MEAIIDSAVADGKKIDAILAENDSTALGVVGALTGKSYGYPPLSGQDGDTANLNNVAQGKQYVDVWKNANELGKTAGAAALALCDGGKMASLKLPDGLIDPTVAPTAGLTAEPFTTPGGNTVSSFILQPTPLTADNLQVAIDGARSPRPTCARASTPRRRRRPASSGHPTADQIDLRPRVPRGRRSFSPRTRRAVVANVADAAPVPSQTQAQPPARPRSAACSRRRRSISGCSACSSPSVVILVTFNILSGGKLIQPTNMVTMAVQAAGIAIIATGMVLVIVSRNIDLSVGSLVGLIAMTLRAADDRLVPAHPRDRARLSRSSGSSPWPSGSASGPASARSRASSSPTSACRPSSSRSAGCCRSAASSGTSRRAPPCPASTPPSSSSAAGPRARSARPITWILGIVGCVGDHRAAVQQPPPAAPLRLPARDRCGRRCCSASSAACVVARRSPGSPTRPLAGGPRRAVRRGAAGSRPAGGLQIPTGFPFPIVLLIGVTLVMTFIATRRRFGRYVYAYGGNPDAAELAGINTRWTILKTYVLMGILCALAAAIAAARLNGATLDVGAELRAVRHRRGRRRRHVVRRRHRDDPGRRPRRVRDAVARVRAELPRRQLAGPERRRRHRADPRRRLRHLQPPARHVSGRRHDQ